MKKSYIIAGSIIIVAILGYLVIRPSETMTLNEDILATLPADDQSYIKNLNKGIQSGGPPKDGIPAIDHPKYESVAEGDSWLLPNDIVFGVTTESRQIAYPQRILVWHEVLNETFDGEHVSVSYCPLTGTAIGYKAPNQNANDPTLGVSGKLVNSNLIMYDRDTDTYWPQILGQGILGDETGAHLSEFPIVWTTWERWKSKYPNTQVLSRETGFLRNYNQGGDPYGSYINNEGYYTNDRIIFRPVNSDDSLSPKTVVVGIRDNERNATAIVKDVLRAQKKITVALGERDVTVTYDETLNFYSAQYDDTGEWINAFDAMWFAWYGYYPDTSLIQ